MKGGTRAPTYRTKYAQIVRRNDTQLAEDAKGRGVKVKKVLVVRRTEPTETSSSGSEEGLNSVCGVFVPHRRPGRCRCATRGCRHREGKLVQV